MNLNNNCYIVCLLVRLCLRHPTPFPSAPQAGWDATKEAANPPSGTVSGARKWCGRSWSRSARSLRSLHSRLRRVLTMRGVGGKVPNGIRFQVLRVPTASKAYGSLRSLSLRHLTYETERDMNRMPRALPFTTGPSRYALRLRVWPFPPVTSPCGAYREWNGYW